MADNHSTDDGRQDDFDWRRQLGRMEQMHIQTGITLEKILAAGEKRDARLESLSKEVTSNRHEARNNVQTVSGQVELIAKGTATHTAQLTAVDSRLKNVEAPIKAAMKRQARRKNVLARFAIIATSIASLFWLILDPIYKVVTETLFRHWFENHGPPH